MPKILPFRMHLIMQKFMILSCLLLAGSSLFAQSNSKPGANLNKAGIALSGYDAVSYFEGKPEPGTSEYSTVYGSATYLFSSQSHKDKFLQNPVHFEPQFGVWCAYAIGKSGELVEVNPKTYKIIEDKLYLFYNANFTNTLKLWEKNEAELLSMAKKNWAKLNR